MNFQEPNLPPHHQSVLDRFVAACQRDARVVAAFLGGSYARGAADAYSDLDIYLITTDEDYENFYSGREAFMRLLGDPLFLEDFGAPNIVFYVFSDGTEGELGLGAESNFHHTHGGPYKVLLDKKGILAGAVFPKHEPDQPERIELLRRQIYWFWHDLSHFITAMGRGQLWWAYGQLEALRGYCVNLARLEHNFSNELDSDEPYFKVEQALPVRHLSPLQATFCPMERAAMLQSALTILVFYKQLAPLLADRHEITYPVQLERTVSARLENLRNP